MIGSHIADFDIILAQYDYKVNPERTKINFNGNLRFRQKGIYEGAELSGFELSHFFIDQNNIVLKIERKEFYNVKMDDAIYPYDYSLPYDERYDSIAMQIRYRGTW